MVNRQTLPQPGETVQVNRGTYVGRAVVRAVYDSYNGPRLLLAVPVLGTDEETLDEEVISVPLDELR